MEKIITSKSNAEQTEKIQHQLFRIPDLGMWQNHNHTSILNF